MNIHYIHNENKINHLLKNLDMDNRLHLTKNQRLATSTFFNTSLLEPQKTDFSKNKHEMNFIPNKHEL